MARPGRPERNRTARSSRQLRRFHHVINSDEVFGTHRLVSSRSLAKLETHLAFHNRPSREHAVQPIPRQSWISLAAFCTDKRTPLDVITKSERCPQADASSNPGVRRPVAKCAIVGFMRGDQGNR